MRSDDVTDGDRQLLAEVLRAIGYRSPAANIRNWCLTRARDLDGSAPLDRHRVHRLRPGAVAADPGAALRTMRVLLDPARAAGLDHHIAVEVDGVSIGGLHVRNEVACPTDGSAATTTLRTSRRGWADLAAGKRTLAELIAADEAEVDGEIDELSAVLDALSG